MRNKKAEANVLKIVSKTDQMVVIQLPTPSDDDIMTEEKPTLLRVHVDHIELDVLGPLVELSEKGAEKAKCVFQLRKLEKSGKSSTTMRCASTLRYTLFSTGKNAFPKLLSTFFTFFLQV